MFLLQFPCIGFQQSHMNHETIDTTDPADSRIIWKIADKTNMNTKLVRSTFSMEHLQPSRRACLQGLEVQAALVDKLSTVGRFT